MKARDLYSLNISLKLIKELGLGDNPSLSDIEAKVTEFNEQRKKEKEEQTRQYRDKIGKTVLLIDPKHPIIKVFTINDFNDLSFDGVNGELVIEYDITYLLKFSYGSFVENKSNSVVGFHESNYKNFVYIDEFAVNELKEYEAAVFYGVNNFKSKVDIIIRNNNDLKKIFIYLEKSKDSWSAYSTNIEGISAHADTIDEVKAQILESIEIVKGITPNKIPLDYEIVYLN